MDPKDQFWNSYSYCGGNQANLIDADGQEGGLITGLLAILLYYVGGSVANQMNGMDAGSAWNIGNASWWVGDPEKKGTGALNNTSFGVNASGGFSGSGIGCSVNAYENVGSSGFNTFSSFGVYNSGLGTSDQNRSGYDITAGFYLSKGSGSGSGMPIYSLNFNTIAGIDNYQSSITGGQFFTYNSATDKITRQGFYGFRTGDFSFYTHNDVKWY